jgi:hypothetical protein
LISTLDKKSLLYQALAEGIKAKAENILTPLLEAVQVMPNIDGAAENYGLALRRAAHNGQAKIAQLILVITRNPGDFTDEHIKRILNGKTSGGKNAIEFALDKNNNEQNYYDIIKTMAYSAMEISPEALYKTTQYLIKNIAKSS